MKISYFVHELEDPAVRRRVKLFRAGGAELVLLGFRRGRLEGAPEDVSVHALGATASGRFLARVASVVLALPRAWGLRRAWRDADVIVARNLEMLAVVVLLRGLAGARGRIVYECLDIHRLMLSDKPPGRVLRAIERALLARAALVMTSSPAFVERYFRARQGYAGEPLIVENKVVALEPEQAAAAPLPAVLPQAGPPWRIAWCGMLRCRRSLEILTQAAAALDGKLKVELWGAPALDQIPDFDALVAGSPHIAFHGRYAAEDLPRIYGGAHFVWAVDYYEAGGNSDWLLPNRLYEGLRQGVPPIAVEGTETAAWAARNGVGAVLPEPLGDALEALLESCTSERYRALRVAAASLPPRATLLTREDARAVVAALAGEIEPMTAAAPAAPAGPKLLVVVPCLNEEAHLPTLLPALARDPLARNAAIVVADGGSTDRSTSIIEALAAADPRFVLLPNPKRIQSAGVNLAAARHGEGAKYLIRVDAHAGYPEGYLSRLVEACEAEGADTVTVAMVARSQSGACFQVANAAAQNSKLGTGGSAHRAAGGRRWVDHGHHALFRMETFLRAGGYDESFTHNEDAELDARIGEAGGRILLAADIVIDYYPRSAAHPLWRQYFQFGRGRARMFAKTGKRPKPRQLAPLAIAPAVGLAVLTPVTPFAALPAAFWLAACLGYGAVLGVKQKSLCAGLAGVPAAIMHLAWSAGFWSQAPRLLEAFRGRRPAPEQRTEQPQSP